ncbi:MAG: hypothetical protein WHV67_03000, partial [Thermoanaerobaculia bacterium]
MKKIIFFIIYISYFNGLSLSSVLETKTLTRTEEPVVLKGTNLSAFYNLMVNNNDPTLSPNQIFVWAYDSGSGWRQVVFQIDEINNAHPNNPPPICTDGTYLGYGPNYMEGDDGLWDSNDELVFMSGETGDRVSLDEWAPGANNTAVRYEITVTDPLDTSKKGWVYIFKYDSVPTWRLDDYVSWNETTNTINSWGYSVDYPDSHTNAIYFTNLSVSSSLGGTGQNLVQKSMLSWYGGFTFECEATETSIRTEMTVTGGGCGDFSLPWHAKDGRVRVIRSIMWMPYCWAITNGIGMYPSTFIRYYRTFWYDTQNMKFRGGTGHCDWIRGRVNHSSAINMTFYDSNNETYPIDGTSETPATKPLWTWYQVSSSYGSYVHVFRVSAKEANDRWNVYTDSGTSNRGNAGWYIDNPTENVNEPLPWHHFYFFMLPPNSSNVGSTYNDYVNSPLQFTSTSQNYAVPPSNFDGIQSTVDVNGACVDEGVLITWDNQVDWNDGCSSGCINRRFVIYRNGTKIRDEYNITLSSWTDTTGVNRTTYNYGVEVCNNNNHCTLLGKTLPGVDYVSTAPVLGTTSTNAQDRDLCTGDGIEISWAEPTDWRDNGEGQRKFDLYWEVDNYITPILTDVTSPVIYDAVDGESHQYRIRATNGCNLYTNYTASSSVEDKVGTNPTLPANPQVVVVDLDNCSPTGVQISWDPVSAWGDNGAGTRRYEIYWSRDNFTNPVLLDATSPAVIVPPDSNLTTYRVVARNGCNLTSTYVDGSGVDAESAPNFAGFTGGQDNDLCNASSITLFWNDIDEDGVEGWNDGGSGSFPRVYRIYRNGEEITNSPVPDGVNYTTDQPPLPDVEYTYTIRAVNMDGCFRPSGPLNLKDIISSEPVANPAQTVASDECDRGEDPAQGVLITWDPVSVWGDNNYNVSGRRYYIYFSWNNFTTPIGSVGEGTLSYIYNPPDNVPYTYRVVVRNGCLRTKTYNLSSPVFDKTSCSPSCTVLVNNNFDTTDNFTQNCYSYNFWSKTSGVGYNGTTAWRANLGGKSQRNYYACLRLSSNITIMWTKDVKLRFWSSVNLPASDAGVVEVWTNDSNQWRKIETMIYPNQNAVMPNTIDDGTGSCATNVIVQNQPAFQGNFSGIFYEARLDNYLTQDTTQINIGFRVASDDADNASTWVIDNVMIGYGIADGVWWWSLNGDLNQGVVKYGMAEATFSW